MDESLLTLDQAAAFFGIDVEEFRRIAVDTGELRPEVTKAVAATSRHSGLFFTYAELARFAATKKQPYYGPPF